MEDPIVVFLNVSVVLQALRFEEEYLRALEEFARSCELSPSWERPQQQQQQLIDYLDNTNDLIHSKGRLKAKRLQTLLQVVLCNSLLPTHSGVNIELYFGNIRRSYNFRRYVWDGVKNHISKITYCKSLRSVYLF